MDIQERNAEIIRQYLTGRKQLDIAAEMGVSKTVVNSVVMGYKEKQGSEEFCTLLRYNERLTFISKTIAPGDQLLICLNGRLKEVTVIQTSKHTVLCRDDRGIKQSPRYTDIEVWNGVIIREPDSIREYEACDITHRKRSQPMKKCCKRYSAEHLCRKQDVFSAKRKKNNGPAECAFTACRQEG